MDNVNYHYYIIYPPSFLQEYRDWWAMSSASQPLGLQWTCLLLMVCACSAQYADPELQRKLQQDLGATTQELTAKYHNAARELHSVIPVGNNHLLNIQSLLHSCYWYKSEARFVECWHVLSAAIREAQELGQLALGHHFSAMADRHQASIKSPSLGPCPSLTARCAEEFGASSTPGIGMLSRTRCVKRQPLTPLARQISALLSRPMIIDRSECQVGLPSLKLEGYSPSPLMHMKLQSELITHLSRRFGLLKHVVSPTDVREYQSIVEAWMSKFPANFALENPDKSADSQRPWIVLHRHHLHTKALSMLLDPIRAYLARPMTANSPPHELGIRSDGIDYCLRLMGALYRFFNHVYPRDAKFHFVLFCIFGNAAVLCSVLQHDEDCSTPRRHDLLGAVDGALAMLKRLENDTKAAKAWHDLLLRVSQRVRRPAATVPPRHASGDGRLASISRAGGLATTPPGGPPAEPPMASDPGSVESYVTYNGIPHQNDILLPHTPSPHSASPADSICPSGPLIYPTASSHGGGMSINGSVFMSASPVDHMSMNEYAHSTPYLNMTPPTEDMYRPVEFGTITQQELGDLASLWNYESLDLHFIDSQS